MRHVKRALLVGAVQAVKTVAIEVNESRGTGHRTKACGVLLANLVVGAFPNMQPQESAVDGEGMAANAVVHFHEVSVEVSKNRLLRIDLKEQGSGTSERFHIPLVVRTPIGPQAGQELPLASGPSQERSYLVQITLPRRRTRGSAPSSSTIPRRRLAARR